MNVFSKLLRILCNAQQKLSIIALLAMVTLNTVEILRRYLFGASIIWVQEITVLLLVWFTFMGFSKITYDKNDIYIDLLVVKAPYPLRRALRIFVALLAFAFTVVYTYYTFRLCLQQGAQTTIVAKHPIVWRSIAPLINGFSMMLIFLGQLWDTIMGKNEIKGDVA